MNREKLSLILKLIIGLLILTYVIHSKMIDFSQFQKSFFSLQNLLLVFSIFTFITIIIGTRWFLLVKAQGLELSYSAVLQLTMIGQFFNTFMPGSVGGDLIKAWYIAGREPNRKTKAVFTVFLDRVIGLIVFFIYSALTLLIYHPSISEKSGLRTLAYTVWSVTFFSFICLFFFYSSTIIQNSYSKKLSNMLRKNNFIAKLLDAAMLYREHLKTISLTFLLSCCSIFIYTLLAKWTGDKLGVEFSLFQYFFLVPIALIASAIPLLPGGIGVGQVAYFMLFKWLGSDNPAMGGTLCTLLQMYTILFSFLGIVFYLKFKRKTVSVFNESVGAIRG